MTVGKTECATESFENGSIKLCHGQTPSPLHVNPYPALRAADCKLCENLEKNSSGFLGACALIKYIHWPLNNSGATAKLNSTHLTHFSDENLVKHPIYNLIPGYTAFNTIIVDTLNHEQNYLPFRNYIIVVHLKLKIN